VTSGLNPSVQYLDTLGITDIARLKQPDRLIPSDGLRDPTVEGQIGCITIMHDMETNVLDNDLKFESENLHPDFCRVASVSCSAVTMSDEPLKLNLCSHSENGAILFVGQGLEPSLQLTRPMLQEYLHYDHAVRNGELSGQGPPPGYLAVRAVFLNEENLPGSLAIWTIDNRIEARGDPLTVQHLFGPDCTTSFLPQSTLLMPPALAAVPPAELALFNHPAQSEPYTSLNFGDLSGLDFGPDVPSTPNTPRTSSNQSRGGRGRGHGRGGGRGRGRGCGMSHTTGALTPMGRASSMSWETWRFAIAERAVYETVDRLQKQEDIRQFRKDQRLE
jgi:hypothetical protein